MTRLQEIEKLLDTNAERTYRPNGNRTSKKERCKMPKCYFCGCDCYSNTTITVNCGNLNQSELFKAYVCADCSESVKSALILLRTVTPKKEGGDSNV